MGKITEIRELYNDTINDVTKSENKWLDFLKTASWNFKYSFNDQILIYAQRPDATACAEMKIWNKKVKRWVNKGSNYIFIFSNNNNSRYPFRFVFDVSDTHNYSNTPYKLWNVKSEYEKDIIESLEARFGNIGESRDLIQAIFITANNMVVDNIQDYMSSIIKYKKETSIENLSDEEISPLVYQTVFSSVAYMMLTRCGIDAEKYINKSEFSYISKFNSNDLTILLGTAISDIAEIGLREIAKTVINLQKEEKNQNHTFVNNQKEEYSNNEENIKGGIEDDKTRIHESGRLQYAQPNNETRTITNRKIRTDEVTLFKGKQERRIHDITNEQQVSTTFNRNTGNGNENDKTNSRENGETRGNDRRIESQRPDEMDRTNEQLQIDSRGTNNEGTNLQLKQLLTEKEQKQIIAEAENASAFSFTQVDINPKTQIKIEDITESVKEQKKETKLTANIERKHRNKIEYFDLHPEIPIEDRNNYKITNNAIGEGNRKEKYQRNIKAIKVLKQCEDENRYATQEEQEILAQYVGWGGITEAFDNNNDEWSKEYAELSSILTEKEYKEAKQSTLTSFYTPPIVIEAIYKALKNMGLKQGNILEPSCRSWKFYGNATRKFATMQNVWN